MAHMPRPGDLVRLKQEICGTDWDRRDAALKLKAGKSYEVEYCEAGASWSEVKLCGIPWRFNAILFDVERREVPHEQR